MRHPNHLPTSVGLFSTKTTKLSASHQQLTNDLEDMSGLVDELITLDEKREKAAVTSSHRSFGPKFT